MEEQHYPQQTKKDNKKANFHVNEYTVPSNLVYEPKSHRMMARDPIFAIYLSIMV